jgi:hypothetical protein
MSRKKHNWDKCRTEASAIGFLCLCCISVQSAHVEETQKENDSNNTN